MGFYKNLDVHILQKVFPETAVYGDKFNDISELPDDSEDDDYNPDAPQVAEDEVDVEDPSSDESDESDFSSASSDLGAIANKINNCLSVYQSFIFY